MTIQINNESIHDLINLLNTSKEELDAAANPLLTIDVDTVIHEKAKLDEVEDFSHKMTHLLNIAENTYQQIQAKIEQMQQDNDFTGEVADAFYGEIQALFDKCRKVLANGNALQDKLKTYVTEANALIQIFQKQIQTDINIANQAVHEHQLNRAVLVQKYQPDIVELWSESQRDLKIILPKLEEFSGDLQAAVHLLQERDEGASVHFGLSDKKSPPSKPEEPKPPPPPIPPKPEPSIKEDESEDDDEISFSDVDDEIPAEVVEEEEDLVVFGDSDNEADDEISIEAPVEKAKADNKPQRPPSLPDSNLSISDDEDDDDDVIGEEAEIISTKETQFTAYYARQSAANTEYGFYVYAHLPDALISADVQQFSKDLGGRIPKPALAKQTTSLQEGALLTAMIHCESLEFNQIGIMKKWEEPFVRFDFRYTAPEALIDEFVEGRVAIMLGMIEIASIDFQTLITAPQQITLINTLPDDPTQKTYFKPTNPASMYQKVFISYSRKDTVVAEEFRKAQIMMGNTVFMDTHSIRAGEDWEEALKRFIREADVFQLFWSEHSADSEHCKFEWEYALNHRCSETRCVGFIRPVYWEQPLPSYPPELGHLHFAYVPQE